MKTGNANRLTDPENLYYKISWKLWKKKVEKFSRPVAAILIIGGLLYSWVASRKKRRGWRGYRVNKNLFESLTLTYDLDLG